MSATILLAPDSFKGSLSARRFCEVAEAAIRETLPDATVVSHPLADGGEGTLEALAGLEGAEWVSVTVSGPLGESVRADYLLLSPRRTAVIEMARASGLLLVPPERKRPLEATTRGTGELLGHALRAGVRRIVLTLGGSATSDAGTGCLSALGFRFLDRHGRPLPPGGGALERLAHIEAPGPDLGEIELVGATDVTTPLLGPTGTARLFAPQKGASPAEVEQLERGLERFAEVVKRDLGLDVAETPGAGAAGGLGAGLLLLGARLVPGFELVAELTGFEETFRRHQFDLVITGEGRLDEQSRHGKVPVAVARIASRLGVPVVAVAGQVALDEAGLQALGFHAARSLVDEKTTPEMAMRDPETALARVVARVVKKWRG